MGLQGGKSSNGLQLAASFSQIPLHVLCLHTYTLPLQWNLPGGSCSYPHFTSEKATERSHDLPKVTTLRKWGSEQQLPTLSLRYPGEVCSTFKWSLPDSLPQSIPNR